MLKNHWYVVLESQEVPTGRPVGFRRLDRNMVFWRDPAKKVHCIHDCCCHRGAKLSHGELSKTGVACPFHGFVHEGVGKVSLIPANGKASEVPEQYRVDAWPVREAFGFIWLWFGDFSENLPELPFFDDLKDPSWSWGSVVDEWPIHYTRAIENQLDVVHLPFVHRNSIGKKVGKVVNGPIVEQVENSIRFWVQNVQDDGKIKAIPADQLKKEDSTVELEFRFGNIWQNKLGPKFRPFLAFVPIDQENTRIYLRIYQKFVTVPLIDVAVNYLANLVNLKVLREDKAVVLTQQPKKTSLKMGEKLVAGDMPIIKFRQYREEQIKKWD